MTLRNYDPHRGFARLQFFSCRRPFSVMPAQQEERPPLAVWEPFVHAMNIKWQVRALPAGVLHKQRTAHDFRTRPKPATNSQPTAGRGDLGFTPDGWHPCPLHGPPSVATTSLYQPRSACTLQHLYAWYEMEWAKPFKWDSPRG